MIDLLIYRGENFKIMMSSLVNNYIDYAYLREKQKPKPINISTLQVLLSEGQKKDVVVEVSNPNTNFIVTRLDYQLVSGERVLDSNYTFIWPGQKKYIVGLGFDVGSSGVSLKINGVNWLRYRADFNLLLNDRLNLRFEDTKHYTASDLSVADISLSRTEFSVINDSAYSLWEVGLYIILSNQDGIVAVNYIQLDKLISQEERTVTVNWTQSLPRVNNIEIIPEVNILDEDIFITYTVSPEESN